MRVLDRLPDGVRRPQYDVGRLGIGIVHLGLGAFHRAHQAVFTDDAIARSGGDWGIVGISLRHAATSDAMTMQDCLYTVEMLDRTPAYRVVGAVRRALFAAHDRGDILAYLSAPATRVITLTITEKGYCLDAGGNLDLTHPDIAHDLAAPHEPCSAIGWLALGLESRLQAGSGPVTVVSCDNLRANGTNLERAVLEFGKRTFARAGDATFPNTMVDCIVPAANDVSRTRVSRALGIEDAAAVQREPFAQWVIENRFAGPRPDWAAAEIVDDVASHERLKLHVLNACHSALAYLGLPRGFRFVREAIADSELARFVDEMVATEIAPALAPLAVADYWRRVKIRLANPMIDHSLAQIAEDGSVKLNARIFPILVANVRAGRAFAKLAAVVRAWAEFVPMPGVRDPRAAELAAWAKSGAPVATLLDDPAIFPDAFRTETSLRKALLEARE
jgi:fructuronate reductase